MRETVIHECVIPGCGAEGRNQIGVRCRVAHSGASPFPNKKRTDALFSVESASYLCDGHALGGVEMVLTIAPTSSEVASVSVVSGSTVTEPRSSEIKQPLRRAA